MDLKLAGFSGKSEDFPAWSTKFVALMHTKGLFRTVMGNDDLPEAEPTLPENPNAFRMFCREMQVKQEFTVPNTPQQNGVAERYNRVITEMTRCLLADAKLSKMFWVRAMSTAVRVRNLCPTSSNEHRISSMEMHYGKPSKVNYLRVFGCLAYYLDRGNRRKLDPKGKKSKFIGYDEESKAYLLMDLETQ